MNIPRFPYSGSHAEDVEVAGLQVQSICSESDVKVKQKVMVNRLHLLKVMAYF